MTRSEYDAIDAVNWSTLKELRRSPAHYAWRIKHDRSDTASMRLGRAMHMAILEPEKFAKAFTIWDEGIRRGKKWDAFQEAHSGKDILTEAEFGKCMSMSAAVRRHQIASKHLSKGMAEQACVWVDPMTGLQCKGLLDWVNGCILDLKGTRDASPTGFARESYRYGYHCQLAHYRFGWAATHGGEMKPVKIVAVEPEPPHVVTVFDLPEDLLGAGAEEVQELLCALSKARADGEWPGYAPDTSEVQLSLPTWALGDEEEDVSALDLVVGNAA